MKGKTVLLVLVTIVGMVMVAPAAEADRWTDWAFGTDKYDWEGHAKGKYDNSPWSTGYYRYSGGRWIGPYTTFGTVLGAGAGYAISGDAIGILIGGALGGILGHGADERAAQRAREVHYWYYDSETNKWYQRVEGHQWRIVSPGDVPRLPPRP